MFCLIAIWHGKRAGFLRGRLAITVRNFRAPATLVFRETRKWPSFLTRTPPESTQFNSCYWSAPADRALAHLVSCIDNAKHHVLPDAFKLHPGTLAHSHGDQTRDLSQKYNKHPQPRSPTNLIEGNLTFFHAPRFKKKLRNPSAR